MISNYIALLTPYLSIPNGQMDRSFGLLPHPLVGEAGGENIINLLFIYLLLFYSGIYTYETCRLAYM